MSSTKQRGTLLRSIGAVFAGLLAVVVISTVTDVVLHATGVFPPWRQPMSDSLFVLAMIYRIVYGIVGGYITARLAPERPILHALILGAIGLLLSIIGAAATWNAGPEFGPRWYPLSLILISIPCSLFGGKLYEMRHDKA